MGHKKLARADIIAEAIMVFIGLILCLCILYPILNIVATSLSSDGHVIRGEVTFYPMDLTFTAYEKILTNTSILRSFGNSIFIALVGCVLSLITTLCAAFPIACCEFPGKKIYNIFVLIPMWFSGGMIPSYLCVQKLGLIDSLWSLILSALISSYYVLILSSFLRGIPSSLVEYARIEGANELIIMWRIIAPLSKASLATIGLWVIAGHWNAYINPMLYLTSQDKFTLQQVLQEIVLAADAVKYDLGSAASNSTVNAALSNQLRYAILVVSMIPMLCLYPFIQKYFVKGATLGAVKG